MARADWLAASGPFENLTQAERLEPDDARFASMDAILRSDDGDLSPAVDKQLLRALQMNPFDSTVLMTLGLRAEFRGDRVTAEKYLIRATDQDHQFKPAWALANFYVRTNRPERIWPLVSRCLSLDPLGFDTAPVFDLCWNATSDAAKIEAVIPHKRPRLIQYLSYLMRTNRVEAASRVWPEALRLADASSAEDAATVGAYPALLVKADRVPDAVQAWNALVEKNIVRSGRLDPGGGVSIADPLFASTTEEGAFSWRVTNGNGAFSRFLMPSLQFDLDGSEPESVSLLEVAAPVIPGRSYRLIWKVDPSRLSAPDDAGFKFRIMQGASDVDSSVCPVLASHEPCVFATRADVFKVEVQLFYRRAPGTTRSKGSLQIMKAALEFAP